jgi:multidrug efflux pump subunit AcrB
LLDFIEVERASAQVITPFPDASAERVGRLVTDRIEKVIQELPELDYVESESRTGLSVIQVNIKQRFKAMRPIFDRLRRKVERVAETLPEKVQGPFVNDE